MIWLLFLNKRSQWLLCGRKIIKHENGSREIILKANVGIQARNDSGFGSFVAWRQWRDVNVVFKVCFVSNSVGLADGLNVGNERKGNYRWQQAVRAKRLNERWCPLVIGNPGEEELWGRGVKASKISSSFLNALCSLSIRPRCEDVQSLAGYLILKLREKELLNA